MRANRRGVVDEMEQAGLLLTIIGQRGGAPLRARVNSGQGRAHSISVSRRTRRWRRPANVLRTALLALATSAIEGRPAQWDGPLYLGGAA